MVMIKLIYVNCSYMKTDVCDAGVSLAL